MYKYFNKSLSKGFTIIEVVVVIVIMAILSTIFIVSYQKTIDNTDKANLRNDLYKATTQLEKYNSMNGGYPASLSSLDEGELEASEGTTYTYVYYSADNSYCLSGVKFDFTYYVTSNNNKPAEGSCS
ncbi:MAG TPA: prepilin-type N-terminal cleavage/methylation domain-containing protein [Candidatus Saccharibacteria bacterium]|nr:prepilin-type N-terminal cleavage/methylation domain-containing protein [Candidatus Saccharibacteria bacterium]